MSAIDSIDYQKLLKIGVWSLAQLQPKLQLRFDLQKMKKADLSFLPLKEFENLIKRALYYEELSARIGYQWESPHLHVLRSLGVKLPGAKRKRGMKPREPAMTVAAALLKQKMTAKKAAFCLEFTFSKNGNGDESGSLTFRRHRNDGLKLLAQLRKKNQVEFKFDQDNLPEIYISGVSFQEVQDYAFFAFFKLDADAQPLVGLRQRVRDICKQALEKGGEKL